MAYEKREGSQNYLETSGNGELYFDHRLTLTQWLCHLAKVTETMVCNFLTKSTLSAQNCIQQ